MLYITNNDFINYQTEATLIINRYKEALQHTEAIKEIITSFKGKLFNKRLETALQKIDENLHIDSRYSFINIYYLNYSNRSYKTVSGHINYNDKRIILLSMERSEMLDDDNRIKADVMLKQLNEFIINRENNLATEIAQLEAFTMAEAEAINDKLNDLINEVEALRARIPSIIKDNKRTYLHIDY